MHRTHRWPRRLLSCLTPMVTLTLLLAACGGGGGGGGGGDTGDSGDGGAAVPLRFTLSGSIGGLTAADLTLTNGIDTVAVTANATGFTMPAPVAFGGHSFIVGAPGEGSSQTTITHGDTASLVNSASSTGAAYAFDFGP